MNKDDLSAVARSLLIGMLAVATLGFGVVGLCGAAVTAVSLPRVLISLFTGQGDAIFGQRLPNGGVELGVGSFLEISVPCLLIGLGVAWWCGRQVLKWLKE